MSNQFPTYLKSNNTGDIGVNAVSQAVNDEMEFIFKRNSAEYDFGIDGYIEIVTEGGMVTGQVVGVQIKCGHSFFKTNTKTGFTFYGEKKHLNYYSNTPFPMIIVICDPDTRKCYWEYFSLEKIEKTATGWKLNIPKRNVLSKKSRTDLLDLVGKPTDFSEEAERQWGFSQSLMNADIVHYSIPISDIENGDTTNILSFFKRILSNDQLAISLQGKIEVSVNGYFSDRRELWEIRSVRKWVKKVEPKVKYWFFFCANKNNTTTLTWLLACLTNTKTIYVEPGISKKINIEYETKHLADVIDRNFNHLNELMERYEMTLDENERITGEAMLSLGFSI